MAILLRDGRRAALNEEIVPKHDACAGRQRRVEPIRNSRCRSRRNVRKPDPANAALEDDPCCPA